MKPIIPIICILLLISSTEVLATKTELTKRLGQTIDQDERQYFNLFPKISGFVSAEFISEGNDKYSFKIISDSSESDSEKYQNISSETIENLNIAVENFEFLNENRSLRIKWKLIIGTYLLPSERINKKSDEIEMKLNNGVINSGHLLYCDSSFVMFSERKLPYDWQESYKATKVVHYSEIESISEPYSSFIDGNKNLYMLNLSYYQKRSLFYLGTDEKLISLPPELQLLIDSSRIKYNAQFEMNDNDSEEKYKRILINDMSSYHIFIKYSPYSYFSLNNDVKVTRFHGDFEYRTDDAVYSGLNQITLSFGFLFNVLTDIQLGINYEKYLKDEPTKYKSSVSTYGYSLSAICNFMLVNRNLYSLDFFDRFDMNLYVGGMFGEVNNQMYIFLAEFMVGYGVYFPSYTPHYKPEVIKHDIFGLKAGINIDYYIIKQLSLNMNLDINILPSKQFTDEKKHTFRGPDKRYTHKIYLEMDSNTINYSGIGLKFGLGFHL